MKCPVCENDITSVKAGKVTVDVCDGGCGGIWFDNFELQKFDEPQENATQLLGNITINKAIQIDYSKKRQCPKCDDITMMRHFFSARRKVEVDECPNCGGYWLDAGELALIREEHQSEQEKQMAAERHLDELSKKQLETMLSGDRKETERAKRISHVFSFTSSIRYRTRPT